MKLWIESLVHLVLPNCCVICKKPISSAVPDICVFCTYELSRYEGLFTNGNAIAKTFWGRVKLQNAFAYLLLKQGNSVQKLIHQLKYKNRQRLGKHLGERMANEIMSNQATFSVDLIIPMPLHIRKYRLRGYNQCSSIAEGMAKVFNAEVNEQILLRKDYQNSQTKKNRLERWENVRGSFHAKGSEMLAGKHILIIDDVLTTGATLEACIACIQDIENIKISIACLAYAP